MSAIRHERRGLRAVQASPYARPAKKSSWSLSSLFSFLNPLRFRNSSEELESEKSPEWMSLSSNSTEAGDVGRPAELQAPDYQHDTVIQIDPGHATHPPGPPQDRTYRISTSSLSKQSTLRLDDIDDSSPARNLEIVTKFLEERGGKPMSNVELEGVISLIRKSAPIEKPQPFRFSCSTSPTPGRDESPNAIHDFSPASNRSTQAPRRMLAKNPNGVYRWRGGGSARPTRSRNRYASPAFGPPRVSSERLVLKDSTATGEGLRTDNKRRRIDEEAVDTSTSLSSKTSTDGPAPVRVTLLDSAAAKSTQPSPSIIPPAVLSRPLNGINSQLKTNGTTNGTPAFRLRPSGLQKPTTPAVPSPLRQAWSGPSSDASSSPAQTSPKPTKVANFMAELIKEVTPPKRPDVSNPYQTASPVKITPSTTRPRPKRPRPTAKPAAPPTSKATTEPEWKDEEAGVEKPSPQAIIEATVPKGSKRARPPVHFEKSTTVEPITISPLEPAMDGMSETHAPTAQPPMKVTRTGTAYIVEEVEEDEEARARVAKKPKPYLNGRGAAPADRRVIINEAIVTDTKDVEMCNANERPGPKAIPLSIGPTVALSKTVFGPKPTSIPKEPSKLRFSYQPETTIPPTTSDMAVDQVKAGEASTRQVTAASAQDPKATTLALPANALPTFAFTFTTISGAFSPAEKVAREKVISKAEASLPTFSFTSKPETSLSTNGVAAPPIRTFNWSAAGLKSPSVATGGDWTCSTCMLSNPASATEKCTVCETPR
ncbi:hypothetical protein AX15_002178 [Amanita polypyramis BW_CC]|nr:hypothetical protein AX15_002178 [Amanita polypyramis BW_CC]